jgi:hypothetical protein
LPKFLAPKAIMNILALRTVDKLIFGDEKGFNLCQFFATTARDD